MYRNIDVWIHGYVGVYIYIEIQIHICICRYRYMYTHILMHIRICYTER